MTPDYRNWLAELLAPLGGVSVRRVFGFDGLYLGDVMFGLVTGERVYLKTDERSRKTFESQGMRALSYTARNGERIVTSYWEIPDRLYDEPEELVEWARQALEVGSNSPTAKRKHTRAARTAGARQPARRRQRR